MIKWNAKFIYRQDPTVNFILPGFNINGWYDVTPIIYYGWGGNMFSARPMQVIYRS